MQPTTTRPRDGVEAVEAIRTSLERYDALIGPAVPTVAAEPPDLTKLGKQADYMWAAFDHGRYGIVSSSLPRLLSCWAAAIAAKSLNVAS